MRRSRAHRRDRRPPHEHLGNLRAALEWCFGSRAGTTEPRNATLGIDLAAASAPAFLEFSLWNECQKWTAAALARLDDSMRGDKRELVLQETRAIASMWTLGTGDDVRTAIHRGLEIAQRLGDTAHRLRLLTGLHAFLIRTTDFASSLTVAEEMDRLARTTNDVSCRVMSDWLRGSSRHFLGDQAAAKQLYESGFALGGARNAQQFGLNDRLRALAGFARALWLSGYPDRALQTAREAIDEAAHSGKPVNVCFSLLYTCHVFLWCGDLSAAQDIVERLMAHPHWQGLPGFHSDGLALQGELLVRRGKNEEGVELLRRALTGMRANRQYFLRTLTECRLAEGLAALERFDEALAVIDAAIADAPAGVDALEMPELLRVRASILLSMRSGATEAERGLMQSLTCARRQGAKAWELRTTMTLAQLRSTQERDEAHNLLAKIYDQFTEGLETHDLKTAEQLLRELDRDSVARSIG